MRRSTSTDGQQGVTTPAADAPALDGRGRALAGGQGGQSLVEFVLIVPIVLLMILGIFDLGRGILYFNMLSNASREGARAGAGGGNILTAVARAVQLPGAVACPTPLPAPAFSIQSTTNANGLTVDVHDGTVGDEDDPNGVRTTYCFKLLTPLIANVAGTGGTIRLSATSRMYVEHLGTPVAGARPIPRRTRRWRRRRAP